LLKIFFPERLARFGYWWRMIALVVVGSLVAVLGTKILEQRYGTGDLHLFMIFAGIPAMLALSFAGARANDIRQKGGDDGMAHLGVGLPLALMFCVLALDMPPDMLQPKLVGNFTVVPLLSAAWFLTAGISVIAFFYLACVGPKDPREQPVDVVMPGHPFMGVPLVLFIIMCFFYGFTLAVAHYKAPALLAAAEKGDANAQTNAAVMYNLGIAKKVDVEEAHKWLARATAKGHGPAYFLLAEMHSEGRGVAKDETKATALYLKAAQKGWATAMLELASRYSMGKGIKRDYVQSYVWYTRAAAGYFDTTDEALVRREALWQLMTPSQKQQAKRLAPKPPPPGAAKKS
jgi:hypothetical protein